MTKIKIYMVIIFILLSVLYVVSIFEVKDQYDKELNETKKLLEEKRKDNKMMGLAIESLYNQVQGKQQIECGVYPLENGYIIDGYYYEFKGEADIQMESSNE